MTKKISAHPWLNVAFLEKGLRSIAVLDISENASSPPRAMAAARGTPIALDRN
jgi:hypothetical protein